MACVTRLWTRAVWALPAPTLPRSDPACTIIKRRAHRRPVEGEPLQPLPGVVGGSQRLRNSAHACRGAGAARRAPAGGAHSLTRLARVLSRTTSLSPSQQQEHTKHRQQRCRVFRGIRFQGLTLIILKCGQHERALFDALGAGVVAHDVLVAVAAAGAGAHEAQAAAL